MSSNFQSYSYSSFSTSSSSSCGGRPGQSHSYHATSSSHSDSNTGTTTTRRVEETGRPTIEETTTIPANSGRRVADAGVSGAGRIEDVTDREEREQKEREYEERMEDEYAKREGYVVDFFDLAPLWKICFVLF